MSGINKELLEALERLVIAAENIGGEHVTEHQQLLDQVENSYRVIFKARSHISLPVTQSAIDAAIQEEEEK